MKIFKNETEIKVAVVKAYGGGEYYKIIYSSPTQEPNCGRGTGNYSSCTDKRFVYANKSIYELIKKYDLKRVPTEALDKMNLSWFKEAQYIINDYILLLETMRAL